MTIRIDNVSSLKKLLAFLAARAAGNFNVDSSLLPDLLQAVERFARQQNLTVKIIDATETRRAVCAAGGAIAGAAVGFMVAGVPGGAVGFVLGAAVGYACAHLTLTISVPPGSMGRMNLALEQS